MKNTKLFALPVIATAILSLASCSSKDSSELHSGILLKNMDTTVNPGNNFTQYVNGTWVKNTKLPSDKSSYGAGSIVNDEAQENVKAIIENAAKAGGKDGSEEQKIGDFYDSYLNMKVRDSIGLTPLKEEFKKIDAIKSSKGFVNYLGYANKVGLKIPFNVSVTEDFKDPKNYMLLTWQGGLGLPDREYYLLTDGKSAEIRAKYLAHIERMMNLSGIADAKAKAAKILALETALAGKHMKKEDTRNTAALYNKYAIKDLGKLTPDFDWNAFLSSAAIKGQDSLVVTQVAYTKDLNAILKSTPLDVWKDYFKWGAVSASSTLLTSALDQANFDFYGKTLYGVQQQKPQWRRAVDMVNGNL
jgi:putative endopeptidase